MKHMLISLLCLAAAPAAAWEPVTSRSAFLSLVEGRALTGSSVNLQVGPDGTIEGRGFGLRVRGAWDWEGRYFCRSLETAIRSFARNCQTVELRGETLRFTSDQGSGDFADLTLR